MQKINRWGANIWLCNTPSPPSNQSGICLEIRIKRANIFALYSFSGIFMSGMLVMSFFLTNLNKIRLIWIETYRSLCNSITTRVNLPIILNLPRSELSTPVMYYSKGESSYPFCPLFKIGTSLGKTTVFNHKNCIKMNC